MKEKEAIKTYLSQHNFEQINLKAALIDMDGVLYDSMKNHVEAWYRTLTPMGIQCTREEFYLYEGRTGASTIRYLFEKQFGRDVSDEECAEIYKVKAAHFNNLSPIVAMPHADRMIQSLLTHNIRPVLVTGSGQHSVLERLENDYPGAFQDPYKVTAYDVKMGKPHPEPYLMGLKKAGVKPNEAIVIENAPLGVTAGHEAGVFTIAVNTGPIPIEKLTQAGANLVYPSMEQFADKIGHLLETFQSY